MESNNNKQKEELYTQAIKAGKRTYFFDVKETKAGEKYMTITESRKIFSNESGKFYFEKSKMFLYNEDFQKFTRGLENAIHFIETGIAPEQELEDNYKEIKVIDDDNFDLL